jgi:ClpX C4-type zinc finger
MSSPCPICAGAVGHGELILVCGGCRDRLGVGAIRTTGEFRVPTELVDDEPATTTPRTIAGCSWCGKPDAEVKRLLGTATVAICNECVALCADILSAELGPDWRG